MNIKSTLHFVSISAAVTHQSSKCYMWGQCHGQSVVTPTETPFTSVHEVFACFASPSVTHIPMITEIHSGIKASLFKIVLPSEHIYYY